MGKTCVMFIECGLRRTLLALAYHLLVCFVCINCEPICAIDRMGLPDDACAFDLRMRGAQPRRADQYLCSGYNVSGDIIRADQAQDIDNYIVRFEALASANKAHHILVYGCSNVQHTDKPWACGAVCGPGGSEQILFAWAKNAPPFSLPKDVGRMIGPNAGIKSIVIQVHYVSALTEPDSSGIRIYFTQQKQPYIAGIYLLLAVTVQIPPNTDKIHADISCSFDWQTSITPFGFRTHAHSLGQVISGYKEKDGVFSLIGKGNPQWPQAFYPVDTKVVIEPRDKILARCTYNSTGRNRFTYIGASSSDEMCNFYIMYYMNANDTDKKGYTDNCVGNNFKYLFKNIPPYSDTPLPRNEALEEQATGHHHSHNSPEEEAEHNHIEAANQNGGSKLPETGNFAKEPHKPGNSNSKIGGNIRKLDDRFLGKGNFGFAYDDGNVLGNGFVSNGHVDDVGGIHYPRKTQQYLYEYEPEYQDQDYYTSVGQRQSKTKKQYYDFDDINKSYRSEVPYESLYNKRKQSLIRNRNKIFDAKYDDYASELIKDTPKFTSDKKRVHPGEESEEGGNSLSPVTKASKQEVVGPNKLDLKFISDVGQFEIGQVGGLAVNDAGELHIFHRGSRVWNSLSFDYFNTYQLKEYPVETDTVIILNTDGTIKRSFGKNRYFLPHGLSLDKDENIWLTDVALHQVFRIPVGKEEPDMTLGMRFEPGTDREHFCKPSDVAVMSTGEFFVSDGYCNSRIMKFDKNGYFIKEWGTPGTKHGSSFPAPGTFNLPHGLTLAEDKNLLCVADRENGRIQCFDYEGNFVRQMHPKSFGSSMYALEYCPKHDGVLFAVNGPVIGPRDKETKGFTIDINTGSLLSTWNIPTQGFTHPHDVTVDTERHLVYVGELNPAKVWKFEMSKYLLSVNGTKQTEEADQSVVLSNDKSTRSQSSTEKISMSPTTTHISNTRPVIVVTTLASSPPLDVVSDTQPDMVVTTVATSPPLDVVPDSYNVDVVIQEDIEEADSFAPSLIIGTLLVIPVLLLVLITILVRLYNTGYFKSCQQHRHRTRSKFNLGNLLNSHKGFDRLSTEDDDHDLENALDDSDNEEFSIVRKA